MKHLVWRNGIAFIANAYNDVEGLEERRMSLLTYGLLEQTTTQRKCQTGGQKKATWNQRQTNSTWQNTDVNESKEAIAWTELPQNVSDM